MVINCDALSEYPGITKHLTLTESLYYKRPFLPRKTTKYTQKLEKSRANKEEREVV